ncbi:hypothetical protein [Luteipulveratus halotolerans]|uniref:Uncharacterized protein n=1 Tax=Luteipulveratus halotolerans TaxID=1631356 RepID=A0A0L6CL23_9MICO|nr:hypothetical protein [Luteipulveratus halotolerans]KNX38345.1 hypothetical protein VV01_16240 [Luteipulveratus halotolerans]
MRRNREAGAATVEYAGILFVVASILLGVIAQAPTVGGASVANAVMSKLCEAIGTTCGQSAAEARARDLKIPCVTSKADRTLGYDASFKWVQAERKDTDTLTVKGDGSAAVTISQGSAIGVTADVPIGGQSTGKHAKKTTMDNAGVTVNADGKVMLGGDILYTYNFPKEYGGQDGAQDFLDDRRSTVNRAIDIVGGPATSTVREGAQRGWNSVTNFVGDHNPFSDGPSKEELAARDRDQRKGTADMVSVKAGVQAEGNLKGEAGFVRGAGQVKGSVNGQVDVALTTDGPDKGMSAYTGQVTWDAKGEATVGYPGGRAKLPPIYNQGGGRGGTYSYKVIYDEKGEPKQLIMMSESREQGFSGFDVKGSKTLNEETRKKASGGVKKKSDTGTLTQESKVLDLTDPANRAAFDKAFVTNGVTVTDRSAKISTPVLGLTPQQTADAWSPLMGQLKNDAIYTRLEYETSGDELSATAGKKELKVAKIGVGGQKTESEMHLVDGVMSDPRNGGQILPLVTCGKK